jgi:hypothetical protein
LALEEGEGGSSSEPPFIFGSDPVLIREEPRPHRNEKSCVAVDRLHRLIPFAVRSWGGSRRRAALFASPKERWRWRKPHVIAPRDE